MDDYRDVYSDGSKPLGSVTPGSSSIGNVEIGGDDDVFAVSLVAGRTYTFNLRGQSSGGGTLFDPHLMLLNATGGYLDEDFDANGNTNDAEIIFTATASATYYLVATGESNGTGTYTLNASGGFVDDYRDIYSDANEALGSLTTGASATGNLEISGDRDVFAVSLVAGRTYTFDLRGQSGGGGSLFDPHLTLLNATGGYLDEDFDASGNTNDAQIIFTATASATYYLVADGESGFAGTYTLSASSGFNDDYRETYNDTNEPLGSVTPGGSSTGHIELSGDADVFAVDLVAGRTYTFDLRGQPTGGGTLSDTHLQLLNATGGFLSESFDQSSTNNDARITYTATASARYYLRAAGEGGGLTGTYTLSASSGFVDDFRDAYNDTTETLGTVAPGGSTTGHVEIGGDRDVFAVSLVAGRTYTFDLKGQPGGGGTLSDAYLQLLNATGGFLSESFDVSSTNNDARITFSATASGTYYLSAGTDSNGPTGTYTLSVSNGTATGGGDDYRDRYDDTTEPLGAVTDGGPAVTGNIETGGDKDVFAVQLVAGRTYSFDINGRSWVNGTLADADLSLLSATGAFLAGGTTIGAADMERLTFTARASGTYYLVAGGETAADVGTYRLTSQLSYVDDYRDVYNDTVENLGAVAPGGSATGYIHDVGDRDVFAVSLVAGRTYTFDLRAQSNGSVLVDPYLELFDAAGGFLGRNFDVSTTNNDARFTFTATTSGTYYLSAGGESSSPFGGYALSVSAGTSTATDDYRDRFNDGSEPLGVLPVNGTRTGAIEAAGDRDVFALTLQAGQSYTIELRGAGSGALADSYLRLLDGAGAVLRFNDDFSGDNSRITFTPSAGGTYYLEASSAVSAGTGAYEIVAVRGYDDAGDSIGDGPVTLPINRQIAGCIEVGGDKDFYAVTLVAGRTYTFDLISNVTGGGGLTDPLLVLLNGSGAVLRTNDDFNSINSRIVFTATTNGTYYLCAHGDGTTVTGSYTLSARLNFDDYRDTPTDGTAALGSLRVGGSLLGTVETAGDDDVFAVTLAAGQTYTFNLKGSAAGGAALADTYLELLNGAGTVLRFNDDISTASRNSQIVFTADAAGTYYLRASGFEANAGTYEIGTVAGAPDDYRDRFNDPSEPLGVLAVGGARQGTIEVAGDRDVFRVVLAAGQTYAFDMTGAPGSGGTLANAALQLLDGAGQVVAANNDAGGTTDARILFTAATAGTYYLSARSQTTAGTGTYTLTAAVADDFADTINDDTAPLGALAVGGSRTGRIEDSGDSDVFAVSLTAGQSYTFDLDVAPGGGTLADGDLRLLNARGTQLRYNDNAGAGTSDARIVFTAAASGTYYLDAGGVGASTGGYTLSASQNGAFAGPAAAMAAENTFAAGPTVEPDFIL